MSPPSPSNLPGYRDLAGRSNLTNSQLLIWLGQRLNPRSPLYNMAMRFDIRGPIDVEKFRHALGDIVRANDAMRSVIEVVEGVPQQRVLDYQRLPLEFLDFSSDRDSLKRCEEEIERRTARHIDLSRANFDTALIKLEPSRHIWFFNQHHLFTDIKSIELIFKEVSKRYWIHTTPESSQEDVEASELPQFANYLAMEHRKQEHSQVTSQDEFARQISFYHRTIRARQTPAYRVEKILSRIETGRLRRLAAQPGFSTLSQELSLFNIIATAFSAYLYRVSDIEEITVGCPVHNRATLDLKKTIGLFIELFPLELVVDPEDTFVSLHEKVENAAFEHLKMASSSKSLAKAVRGYNVVMNYITAEFADFATIPCEAYWLHNHHMDPQHDLRFQIMDFGGDGELRFCFDINKELMDQEQGSAALSHFINVFDALLSAPESRISETRLSSEAEARDLIKEFSSTHVTKPVSEHAFEGYTVLNRLNQLVADTPEAIAATIGKDQITYSELDHISGHLAHFILQKVDNPELVGVCAARSFDLLIAIFAILKSGAAFVPLDPAYPDERLHQICSGAGLRLVLTDAHQRERLDHLCELTIEICSLDKGHDEDYPIELPEAQPENNAYVIFTSGSTGDPKGVVVRHRALWHYVTWAAEAYCKDIDTSAAVFPLYSSIGFDLTITSIFVPLFIGGSIKIYPRHHDTVDLSIFDVIQDDDVDVIKLTPAHLSLLAGMNLNNIRAHTLILGGEDLATAVAERARKMFKPGIRIFNEYGPTEAVVGCMIHQYTPKTDNGASVPIGRPADGVNIYLLDAGGNPVPEGVTGELWIGGERMSSGYFNQPNLTKERFHPDPFLASGVMYKTGDLARVNSRKQLVFQGRKDTQVKIRGVRIETAEISHAVRSHPLVGEGHVSVLQPSVMAHTESLHYCIVCGLASNYPGVSFDHSGKCNQCRDFESYRDLAASYFRTMPELRNLLKSLSTSKRGQFDVMMLLSGGKDSTYALYQICAMGLNVFAMTLDNGYISDGAKANIRRSISDLGIEHEFVTSAAMNEIFADSLNRHSSVCYGCFKTIYTLAINSAHQHGIPVVVTGLSRGQMFETRLTKQVFEHSEFDPDLIDQEVLEARKIYHRIPDKVTECVDMSLFASDDIFDEIKFVDFYRYCDVSMEEMYAFLEKNAPWTRPADTGRSTNCLINDTGIYVHKNKAGYHNYALPYAWDVRLGHKQREAALEELNDQIDASRVHEILQEINFQDTDSLENNNQKKLVVYYTGSELVDTEELRAYLLARLPEAMVPTYFVHVDHIPLTTNGKVDETALPDPRNERPKLSQAVIPAKTATEKELVRIWREALRINQVGIYDNFFDLGGDSIIAIQIVVRAGEHSISITPNQLFFHQTIHQLAEAADTENSRSLEKQAEKSEPFSLVKQDASIIDNLSSLLDN